MFSSNVLNSLLLYLLVVAWSVVCAYMLVNWTSI